MSNIIFNPNATSCFCKSTSPVSSCSNSKNTECCLIVCNILTEKDIYPCNEVGELDITKYVKIPTCCKESDIKVEVKQHTENIKNVGMFYTNDKKFLIQYTSNYSFPSPMNYKNAELVYQVQCGILKVQAKIVIPFKQHNDNPNCTYGKKYYDPCTGNCTEPDPEIKANTLIDKFIKLG